MNDLNLTQGLELGFHSELDINEYHAAGGYSRSQLTQYECLPEKFYNKYIKDSAQQEKPSQALSFGSAFHVIIQEPHLFDEQFAVSKKFDKRTKAGKEAALKFSLDNADKQVITEDELAMLQEMKESVLKNDLASSILANPKTIFESSIVWKDKPTGLTVKCRPDILSSSIIADLKTTQDASPRAFQSSCNKYGYYLQAAMMKIGLESIGQKMDHFIFIACEKAAPFSTACYVLDEESLAFGEAQFRKIMDGLSHSLKTNQWPGYGTQELALPKYLKIEN